MKGRGFQWRTPYSFRARITVMLLAASLLAGTASLTLAFLFSQADVQTEKSREEQTLAQMMVRLNAKGSLTVDEIAETAAGMGFRVTHIPEKALQQLSADELSLLRSREVSTFTAPGNLPVTYAVLGEDVVMIEPSGSYSLIPAVFWRVLSGSLSFVAVFLMAMLLVSVRVSRPITVLTAATRRVAEGDFSVKLNENEDGEVGELMASFNRMTEALDRNAWLQKDFISNVSHEFKNPIATIKGYTELLRMEGITESQRREFLTALSAESVRLSRLSETLLRLSALEKQAASAETSDFRLDEQLRQAVLRMEPVWSARNIGWEMELDSMVIHSDSELLAQVWTNLIDNAVKFSPEGGTITIRSQVSGGEVQVTVADQGIGMDEETVKRIFDAFYQADRSRSAGGVGLGLSLVRRILDILGGRIEVQSQPGEGSAFTVTLPA
ncbi:MAG: HAMP domain-containing histidine kinase [Clostridia bacterium]|nr:HAMP domain-containing histidine kinase [Clostridia bacterium]